MTVLRHRIVLGALLTATAATACNEDPSSASPAPSTSTTLDAGGAVVVLPPGSQIPQPVPPPVVVQDPPAITADVRDVTVPLGATAVFRVVATGTSLLYQWEQGSAMSFTPIAGATGPTLTLANVTEAMTLPKYRVKVTSGTTITSREAALTVFGADQIADLYAQHPPNVVDRHPTLVTASGVGYSGSAEMATGHFRVSVDGIGQSTNTSPFSYVGFLAPLTFVNHTGSTVVVPAGAIKLETEGTYAQVPDPPRTLTASFQPTLQADGAGITTTVAQGSHQWALHYDAGGNVLPTSRSTFTQGVNQAGGTATSTVATFTALRMAVSLGEVTIPPEGRMNLRLTITLNAQSRVSADFSTIPSKLTVVLPRGVDLDRNTSGPLTWVTNAP